jgi:hypothetical protein
MEPSLLLKTPEASQYLAKKGVKRSPKTLAKLRTVGGGPPFKKFGEEVFYWATGLDGWVEGKLSLPLNSTSELPDRAA